MVLQSVIHAGYYLLDRVSAAKLLYPFSTQCTQGLVPDFVVRRVIRALLRERLREIDQGSFEANHAAKMDWIEQVRARDKIADVPEKANEQHYEV